MAKQRTVPSDHPAFAALPAQMVTVGSGDDWVAVHISGTLSSKRVPVMCVPGYHRNMADFSDFIGHLHRVVGDDWPMVLIDLRGRGRASDRKDARDYGSLSDARDIGVVADALGIESAIMVGQGFGGQVSMALSAMRPRLVAGAVLIDAGPVSDPRGLVRLRTNMAHIEGLRGANQVRNALRRMLAVDYPNATEVQLDGLGARTHFLDRHERARPLFDMAIIKLLDTFEHDDVLVAQWPLFHALSGVPVMMMRSQLTDQLRRETFEEMGLRRPDALSMVIDGQGSPALLNTADTTSPIADFVRHVGIVKGR